jgi:hypothetical protein
MFTGFASENTPAIQVWDFWQGIASTSARRYVYLEDDCAPIQFFKTGNSSTSGLLRVYLPSAPIEGRKISIINAQFGSNATKIQIFSSDTSGAGSNFAIYTVGPGQQLDLVYSKNAISLNPTGAGAYGTGWISLNQGASSAANYSSVCFGFDNQAGAIYSAVVGGSNNTASQSSAFIGGGQSNSATSGRCAVIGGEFNTASALQSVVVGGQSSQAAAENSVVIGGTNNSSSGDRSVIIGGALGSTRSIVGCLVTPASLFPVSSTQGGQQLATLLLGRQTTDATATRLTSNTSAESTTNQVILPNNSAYTFQGTCIANVTGGGTTSGWKFEGAIKRGANAASTTLVAAVIPTVIAQDIGAVTWVLAITADTTRGGIAVTVTGAAATTIRWVVKIETTEVTF